ncbi:uncharacterized protein F13E9.13, mitochondrial-like [Saccostrea echinata]|uniref:uncharacterized protein F13E9.13, mitochondrial-like n=1 Tax=Saccostrea echinata TaxID=191078 RepID=UPI002A803C65|nr:uncharacterized protein F13E9.13, mitochondrial-like [Saccostrea echinata]
MPFSKSPFIIGMIHVPALPGTPRSSANIRSILSFVRKEASIYWNAGVDSILVENMHDLPYVQSKDIGPEIVACMTRICSTAKVVFQERSLAAFIDPHAKMVNSLRGLFSTLPGDIQDKASKATYSSYFEDGNEYILARFPGCTEEGKGSTKAEAKTLGLLHLCENLIDEDKLDQKQVIAMYRHDHMQQLSNKTILQHFNSYCNEKKLPLQMDTVWDDEQKKFKGSVFVNGELLGEEYGNSKRSAKLKSCWKALKTKNYVGAQILAGGNRQALAVAQAAELDYIRAEGFVYSHVADEGWMDSCAGDLLRYRKQIGAKDIKIFTDIKKKHSAHAITSDISLVETARAAELFGSDGVIVTGTATGVETKPNEVQDVMRSVSIPVLVGSGVTTNNVHKFQNASGLIVGSHFKRLQRWDNQINVARLLKFMLRVRPECIDYDKVFRTPMVVEDELSDSNCDFEIDEDLDIK